MTRPADRHFQLTVRKLSQVQQAATMARRFAEDHGFPEKTQWEISTIAAELASNMVKHAGSGVLSLSYDPSVGITLTAEDPGPFIGDPEKALEDGYSKGRMLKPYVYIGDGKPESHGSGLGAVWRLSDEMDIQVKPDGGTRVTAVKSKQKRKKRK